MKLKNNAWRFTNEFYSDVEKFNIEMIKYQKDIYETAKNWKPNEIVFDFPELEIQYMAWVKAATDLLENESLIESDKDVFDEESEEEGHQVEILARLKAENGKNFSALEFLMKTHNQMWNKELGDHVFFEGTKQSREIIDGITTCFISCGS